MRLIVLFLICIDLMAVSVDPLLLKAQASIFPKIMLLDKDISKKATGDTLILSIVHTGEQHAAAQQLKEMINLEYKDKLGTSNLEVRLENINDFDTTTSVASYYIFDASLPKMKKVLEHAKRSQRICFGYNYKEFVYNTLVSLFVKEKTYIYLNKSVLQEYRIKFTPIFYRIAKTVE